MSYPVETDEHGNAIPPQKEEQSLGGLQPETVKKSHILKCPKCGSTTFHLIKNVDIVDTLSFDDQTDEPFIELYNISEAMQHYIPHKQCDKIECAECGEPIPKEAFKDLPDEIKMDY